MACRSCHSQTVPPDAYAAAYAQWETGDRPLLVVFGAKWCGPCREVDAKLPELARDFVIVHLDVDRDRALIARYGLPKPERFLAAWSIHRTIGINSAPARPGAPARPVVVPRASGVPIDTQPLIQTVVVMRMPSREGRSSEPERERAIWNDPPAAGSSTPFQPGCRFLSLAGSQ